MELLAARIALDEIPLEHLREAVAELISAGNDEPDVRAAIDPATPPWELAATVRRALEDRGLVLERRRAFVVLSVDIARRILSKDLDAEQGARRMRALGERLGDLLQLSRVRALLPSQGGQLHGELATGDEIDIRYWDYFAGAVLEFEEVQDWSWDQVRFYREVEARVLGLAEQFVQRHG